jgi:hypothetical protein
MKRNEGSENHCSNIALYIKMNGSWKSEEKRKRKRRNVEKGREKEESIRREEE